MSNQPAVDSEIRDVLLETYAANDPMNQLLLEHIDQRVWRAQPLVRTCTAMMAATSQLSSPICTTTAWYGSNVRRLIFVRVYIRGKTCFSS